MPASDVSQVDAVKKRRNSTLTSLTISATAKLKEPVKNTKPPENQFPLLKGSFQHKKVSVKKNVNHTKSRPRKHIEFNTHCDHSNINCDDSLLTLKERSQNDVRSNSIHHSIPNPYLISSDPLDLAIPSSPESNKKAKKTRPSSCTDMQKSRVLLQSTKSLATSSTSSKNITLPSGISQTGKTRNAIANLLGESPVKLKNETKHRDRPQIEKSVLIKKSSARMDKFKSGKKKENFYKKETLPKDKLTKIAETESEESEGGKSKLSSLSDYYSGEGDNEQEYRILSLKQGSVSVLSSTSNYLPQSQILEVPVDDDTSIEEHSSTCVWEDESFCRLTKHMENMRLSCMDALGLPTTNPFERSLSPDSPSSSSLSPRELSTFQTLIVSALGQLNEAHELLKNTYANNTPSSSEFHQIGKLENNYKSLFCSYKKLREDFRTSEEENRQLRGKLERMEERFRELEIENRQSRERELMLHDSW